MSDCKINIRFLWWHFQFTKSNKVRIGFNKAHWIVRGIIRPIAIYELSLK